MNFKEKANAYREDLLKNLKELVSYNSVSEFCEGEYPFGKVTADTLEAALRMCRDYGFRTQNLDNYCGYAEMGEGEQVIGIIGHLDIVPAGEGWDSDPFTMIEKDGKVYGRGVSDDKGAVVAGMIAMKIVQDLNIPLQKRVRLIMGLNEEKGSKCLAHYVEKEGHIDLGFTPDGDFPGVHGEKGMVSACFESKSDKILDMVGGTVSNAVCEHCITKVKANCFDEVKFKAFLAQHDQVKVTVTTENEVTTLDVWGVAAHASTPQLGVNAISMTLEALYEAGIDDPFVTFYHDTIGLTYDGSKCSVALKDDYGALTFCNGLISMKDGVATGSIDIRFPVTLKSSDVVEPMKKGFEHPNGTLIINKSVEPLYYPMDSPLVSRLLSAYQEVTGDTESKPLTMGGGTYAKGIHNCIAFGCGFEGKNYNIHNKNEWCGIDDLLLQVQIYVQAILNLIQD